MENDAVRLRLGDVIEITAPTNLELNSQSFLIEYIDETKMKLGNIANLSKLVLKKTDESVRAISLLYRNPEYGYARQNGFMPHVWLDIHIGGDIPIVLTGEITNLEEDMIEVRTFPDNDVIYIDFCYRGLPDEIPFEKIVVRQKPAIEEPTASEPESAPDKDESASMDYAESGQQILRVPKNAVPDDDVRGVLQSLYLANQRELPYDETGGVRGAVAPVFGEELEEAIMLVELPAHQQRFGVELQANDMMDEMIATIPNAQRTPDVMMTIHTLISRFKQLRSQFSKFDDNRNVVGYVRVGHTHKPLVDRIRALDARVRWIIPTVAQKRYLRVNGADEHADAIPIENKDQTTLQTFVVDADNTALTSAEQILADMETVVDNMGDFVSTAMDHKSVSRTKFVIQRYNLGDKMTMKSLVVLPEPFVRYSQIALPGTDIASRVSLHAHNPSIFRTLNEISTYTVDDVGREMEYKNTASIKQFRLDETLENEPDKFRKFLNVILPNTRTLLKEYLQGRTRNISFVDVVRELEPFFVYGCDITYSQHNEIRFRIKQSIKEYKQRLAQRRELFQKMFVAPREAHKNRFEMMLLDKPELAEMGRDGYHWKPNATVSELLNTMRQSDNATLFSAIVATMGTQTPENLMATFDPPKIDDMSEKVKPKDCVRRNLAKRYTSTKELQTDNGKAEVYYDKEMDDTPYQIMDAYSKEKKKYEPKMLLEFVRETLIQKHDVAPSDATELAEILIAGKKKIGEGDYAVLSIKPLLKEGLEERDMTPKEKAELEVEEKTREKIGYYHRVHDQWIRDSEVDADAFADTNQCAVQSKGNPKMKDEFANRMSLSQDQAEAVVRRRLANDFKRLVRTNNLREHKNNKYNNIMYEMGKFAVSRDELVSPHATLRDEILNQTDFVKLRSDIARFVDMACREPMGNVKEDEFWLYCRDTNTKLFPQSLWKLAMTPMNNYSRRLAEICASHGILSDDGDAIVDKHSGYVLRKIDFVEEDGYTEEGFRIVSHEVMEQDLKEKLSEMFSQPGRPHFENKANETIYNIVDAICKNVGIPTESIQEFVMRTAIDLIDKNVQSQAKYEETVLKLAQKKQVKPIPYDVYKNRLMFWIVAANMIVAIQTAVPSFRVKKTFPGCVRSFSGYPLDGGAEDMTCIQYFACVMKGMGSEIVPWNSIKTLPVDTYATRIRETLDKFVIPIAADKYSQKREYLISHPNEVIPEEHTVAKWRAFLPPIVPFAIDGLRPVSKDMERDFLDFMRKGHKDQRQALDVIAGRCALYGYGIVDLINKIIRSKTPILQTASRDPFLENACCNEAPGVMEYFAREDANIKIGLNVANSMSELLNETRKRSFASSLYHREFSGIVYPVVSTAISEADIYGAFIKYCNFDNDMPIPGELLTICAEKTAGYPVKMGLDDKIEFLKKSGKRYKEADLSGLMTAVRNMNLVGRHDAEYEPQTDVLLRLLDDLDGRDSDAIDAKMREHLRATLNTYNPKVAIREERKELNGLKNYLARANSQMYGEIVRFLDKHGNLSDAEYERTQDLLLNITMTNLGDKEAIFSAVRFVQNSIFSMGKWFPAMILSGKVFDTIPEHWDLSDIHWGDMSRIITKQWGGIREFSGDKTIAAVLRQIHERVSDIHDVISVLPVYLPIAKDGKSFYSLFDNEAINFICVYLWYSVLFEYVAAANSPDLLRADVETKKRQSAPTYGNGGGMNDDELMEEMDVRIGDESELRKRVANLMTTFLGLERENRGLLLSYEEISKKIRKEKNVEKQKIVEYLGKMSNEERKVEDMFKKYKMGRWNVGMQKGLFKYDKETYDRERTEMDVGMLENDLEPEPEPEDKEGYDISGLGEDYTDGVFYEEDREE